jgi:hypothetical protein
MMLASFEDEFLDSRFRFTTSRIEQQWSSDDQFLQLHVITRFPIIPVIMTTIIIIIIINRRHLDYNLTSSRRQEEEETGMGALAVVLGYALLRFRFSNTKQKRILCRHINLLHQARRTPRTRTTTTTIQTNSGAIQYRWNSRRLNLF